MRPCKILSTEMHSLCPWPKSCDCECHLQGGLDGNHKRQRRPHSYPREDWGYLSAGDKDKVLRRVQRRWEEGRAADAALVLARLSSRAWEETLDSFFDGTS